MSQGKGYLLFIFRALRRSAALFHHAAHHVLRAALLADVRDFLLGGFADAFGFNLRLAAGAQVFLLLFAFLDVALGRLDISDGDGLALRARHHDRVSLFQGFEVLDGLDGLQLHQLLGAFHQVGGLRADRQHDPDSQGQSETRTEENSSYGYVFHN